MRIEVARLNLKVMFAVFIMAVLLAWPVQTIGESCIECHLHRSLVEDFTSIRANVETLAGFHGREFIGKESGPGCRKCHGNRQDAGKLPDGEVCIQCHTRSKTALGDPETVFHAEKEHWLMEKISCTDCHMGHVKGNPEIKFLTTDVVNLCSRCHERSFKIN